MLNLNELCLWNSCIDRVRPGSSFNYLRSGVHCRSVCLPPKRALRAWYSRKPLCIYARVLHTWIGA